MLTYLAVYLLSTFFKVYVDMFEKSKKKYNEQLDLYYSKH